MFRFIIVCIIVIGYLILSIPILIGEWFVGKQNKRKKDISSLRIIQAVFRLILKVTGADITIIGHERVPKDQAVLYIGNHRSYFDILLTYVLCPDTTGYIAKKEMEPIPLLSNWMKYLHCLFLDRKDLKAGLKTILEGVEKVKKGISIWIFPEGTRNSNEEHTDLLPFREGSLKIAEKSGCAVIPVAMVGNADIFENHLPRIRKTDVTIRYGQPIYLKELPAEFRKKHGAYVRDVIIQMLKEIQENQQ